MIVLGIETSCDETAAGVVEDGRVLSNVVARQTEIHARFGGVVPELASRAHLVTLNPTIDRALAEADLDLGRIDGIAVTIGPGLIGALLVGVSAGKALAWATGVPFIGVNHLDGHVEAAFIERPDLAPPLVALIVSGGHTLLALSPERGRYEVLGRTVDDAAGEAFDKIARFLGLGFPGGPVIDDLARTGDPGAVRFPRAMMDEPGYDFSLSGLKTAVIRWVRERRAAGEDIDLADLAASFQEAVVDVQVAKTLRACEERGVTRVVAAGGVAANSRLRERLSGDAAARGIEVVAPSLALCTDNGAMIAAAGLRRLARGERTPLDAAPDPNLGLG